PLILRRNPFFASETTAPTPNGEVAIRAYQIIVWVSVLVKGDSPEQGTPRFPAVVDTGNNHNFSLQEEHLIQWSGNDIASLRRLGRISIGNLNLPLLAANVWLYRNLPGQRDQFSKGPP